MDSTNIRVPHETGVYSIPCAATLDLDAMACAVVTPNLLVVRMERTGGGCRHGASAANPALLLATDSERRFSDSAALVLRVPWRVDTDPRAAGITFLRGRTCCWPCRSWSPRSAGLIRGQTVPRGANPSSSGCWSADVTVVAQSAGGYHLWPVR